MSKPIHPYRNLVPGQWQIESIIMGTGTNIRLQNVEVKPYDINAMDYQVIRSDEMRFGFDALKPTTIEFTMSVLNNYLMPGFEDSIPNFWHDMPTISDLARAWRADDVRKMWGEMKSMYVVSKLDEIPKLVFGRPGQFTTQMNDEYDKGEIMNVVAEFRRADTLAYSAVENYAELELSEEPVYLIRNEGDGPDAWFRLVLEGPLDHPIITVGNQQVNLDYNIAEGEIVEVSSYPWQRRVVNNERTNLAATMIGDTRYLDQLSIPYKVPTPLKWTSANANTWYPALGNKSWIQDIGGLTALQYALTLQMPPYYTAIHNAAKVRMDLFNFGSPVFPWITPRFYIGAGVFEDQTAVLYNGMTYFSNVQTCQARIVNPNLPGKSALVIMSNATMTNFVCLIIETNVSLQKYLHIASGTSWNSLTVRDSWFLPAPLWLETDRIMIKSTVDPVTDIATYHGYHNNTEVVTWEDDTGIVTADAATNKYQGFIFDIDGNLFTAGAGFAEILSYDSLQEEAQEGKVTIYFRDTYSVI